jgi:hypothetical protein
MNFKDAFIGTLERLGADDGKEPKRDDATDETA